MFCAFGERVAVSDMSDNRRHLREWDTRIEGEKIYFNPSEKEGTAGNDERLKTFDMKREASITKADLLKYETEQGDDRKVIIWINP